MRSPFMPFRLFVVLVPLLFSVSAAYAQEVHDNPAPDYADAANWSALPDNPARPPKPVDVFFMHPTTYGSDAFGMNAPVTDPGIRAETDATVADQASAFAECCNVYAPRYRQVSIKVLGMPKDKQKQYLSLGVRDMRAAFTHYLVQYNKGRPFILAGHSQGSNVAKLFLTRHRDMVPDAKFVAAYLPGWTFTQNDLKAMRLPLAKTPTQTGALVVWNTVGKGGKSPTLLPGALCVNPLTWTTDKAEAPASLDSYARIPLADGTTLTLENFTPARINEAGGLEIPTPAIVDKLSMAMGPEVYHRYDYAFFYGNIAANAKARCDAWLSKHKQKKKKKKRK